MDQFLQRFVQNSTTLQKGVFLLICGVLFVFVVQVVFYLIVKLWPRPRAEAPRDEVPKT
jgi:Na+-transporting methylmalonyl-CoA/oxaloacetate decarboxylase gamma subunit